MLLKRDQLVRIRHGAYVDGDLWHALGEPDRHRLRARAVLRNAGTDVVLSHTTSALEHGASGWGFDLAEVHLTRLDGRSGRREAGVVQHRGRLPLDQVISKEDVRVTSAARCIAESSAPGETERTLVLAHELMFRRIVTEEQVISSLDAIGRWPGALSNHALRRLLPARCESPAETRFLHLCHAAGIPLPQTQLEIHGPDGRMIARVDAAWPELGVFVEIDGRVKYDDPWGGLDPSEVLWREKRREDEIRAVTGWRCLRVTWADLEHPRRLIRRLRALLTRAAA